MANEQNLIHFTSDQDREEAKKNGRKGGKASGEARRAKRTMAEQMELALQITKKKGAPADLSKIHTESKLKDANLTQEQEIVLSAIRKAKKGNVQAIQLILDLVARNDTNTVSPLSRLDETLKQYEDEEEGDGDEN